MEGAPVGRKRILRDLGTLESGLLAAALFAAWRRYALSATYARVLLVLLLLLELGNTGQYNFADRSDRGQMQWLDKIHANADIAGYLRKQPGFQRTEVAQDAFAANWGAFHGVEMHGGMLASATSNVLQSQFFSLTGRRMYGVAYTIATAPQPDAGDEVFAGASGMKVYPVSYTHLRAHETGRNLVCRL